MAINGFLDPANVNKITKIRELLVLSIQELFKNHPTLTFVGDDSNENKIWVMDEENDSVENNQCFPRIVISRHMSGFSNIAGIGQGHPSNFSMLSNEITQVDMLTHNFSIQVKSFSFNLCEAIGYTLLCFFKYFEREIISRDSVRLINSLSVQGLSATTRVAAQTEKNAMYSCQIPLSITDCDIISREDLRQYPQASELEIKFSFLCEGEE